MNLFEKASRHKWRFPSVRGLLTVEDLWELPLKSTTGKPNLDDIAKALHRQLKNDSDVSFVDESNASDPTIQGQFDLVRHIIADKKAAAQIKAEAAAKAAHKQKILEILDQKQDESLRSKSVDELRKELEGL